MLITQEQYLEHHGILGQKWGVKNGPPYPLGGGDYSKSEKKAIYKKRRSGNSIYNKKHFDEVLDKDKTELATLAYDRNRTKDTDMFFAATNFFDKQQYNALFNKPVPKTITDENGNKIGTGIMTKVSIRNKLTKDIKVASEDSGAKILMDLYEKDRDFYNFITDDKRMQSYFVSSKYKFKGYREAKFVLDKMKDENYIPTDKDLTTVYRMFNYIIPYDGGGSDTRGAKDVLTQRAKFFKEAKDAGYGALLDTNDAIYGGFKAKQPVIVFDMENVVLNEIKDTSMASIAASGAVLAARKALRL